MTTPHPADLPLLLFSGLDERPLWGRFISHMRRRTGADDFALIVQLKGSAPEIFASQAPSAAQAEHRAEHNSAPGENSAQPPPDIAALSAANLFPYAQLRPGRVYALEEMQSHDDAALAAKQRHLLDKAAIRHARFMRAASAMGHDAWLFASHSTQPFAAGDAALLSSLAPALGLAVDLLAERDSLKAKLAVAESALARLGVKAELSPAAHSDATLHSDEALLLAVPETAMRRLQGPAYAKISRDFRLTSSQSAQAFLQRRYALTPREAELAFAIAAGQSIAEAARSLALTVETARNYSKRIYAKTDTLGQPGLVRLVLSGLAPLAPDLSKA